MNINGTGNNAERIADVIGKLGGGSGVGAASLLSLPSLSLQSCLEAIGLRGCHS